MKQFEKHNSAMKKFVEITSNPSKYLIIHYSCESFVDKEDGRTPRITTIAVRYFESSQTKSFSIHEIAEQHRVPIDEIEVKYDELEFKMLEQFFEFVDKHDHYYWIHWNMRDTNYGFYAIENRFKVLGGDPTSISDDKKIDLARTLVDCYGRHYIGNPRMEKLADKNNMTKKDFLTGGQEADAFEAKQYIALRNSTLRKVDLFYSILTAAAEGTLETDSTWKDIYGVSVQGIFETLMNKWWFHIMEFLLGIILGAVLGRLLG